MPLTGREVYPSRVSQIQHFIEVSLELKNTHNLEETTCIASAGILKQLVDISTFADEIFGDIYNIAKKTVERSSKLHKRLITLNEKLKSARYDDDTSVTVYQKVPGLITKEQTLLTKGSRPKAVKNRYEICDKSPALHKFIDLSIDGSQPHLLYSDPSLFVNAWLTLMDKEAEKFKKHRKRSFKKQSSRQQKIATLKKKVHDPKSKTWTMVNVEPQYATLPIRGDPLTSPSNVPLSAALNRKRCNNAENVKSPTSPKPTYSDPRASTPIKVVRKISSPGVEKSAPSIDVATPENIINSHLPEEDSLPLPPPPEDLLLGSYDNMPSPPPTPPPVPAVTIPPPFKPPPVPEEAIKPPVITLKQRVLRTNEVVEDEKRDTLLNMIRTSSFNLRPVPQGVNTGRLPPPEPTYASYQGTDVASILQRRKYLMGVDMNDSEYSSTDSESDDGGWD